MARNLVPLYCAVAAMVGFGICGRQELKAQDAVGGAVRVGQVDVLPNDGFDAGTGLYQGIMLAGANPPKVGPPPTWPCLGGGGDSRCSNIQAPGFVIPVPAQVVPVNALGEVVWTLTTTTATGTAAAKLVVTQGATTIYSYNFTFPVTANGTWYAYVYNATLSGAKKGSVTATVTTTVGTATITGKTVLQVQ
jgi:hypothetical protein